jgi:hypothetical protein
VTRDRSGWMSYCLSVLFPGVIVFGVTGWTASKSHGAAHAVLAVATVAVWVVCAGLLVRGGNKYLR